ncbi:MAG TPA: T9SS type A sorting domain-containing protein [Candidatus Eisenbacteria bacterium]|nr:T9SS type A sorting domain-containing protein [Candidatus Eisenbacteria bacterium]
MGSSRASFAALFLLAVSLVPCVSFAQTDTVSVGFLATSADPNKVHVGGVWDFDTPYYAKDISGTDSTQFWTFLHAPPATDSQVFTTTVSRPFWYYDWGNNINAGDHNLWMSRVGKRIFRRTGLAGVWHEDDLSTVPDTGQISPGFSHNISGSGSAWCGLRLNGDPNAPFDAYTGNAYTSDQQDNDFRSSTSFLPRSAYPGYASQWDQLLYRDFSYDGGTPGTIAFDYRAELDPAIVGDQGIAPNDGGGWFTPDPFSTSNLVHRTAIDNSEPVDSFEVWVGAPRETGVYDSAHRYLSDTIDFGLGGADAPKLIFSLTGSTAGSANIAIPGGASWQTVRVVLRVKTNRFFDDRAPASVPSASMWNSVTGAVVVDNLNVNGTLSDFETPGQIVPRFTWTPQGGPDAMVTENSPSNAWITTGRQPAHYGHIHDLGSLPFAPYTNPCELSGNIAVQSNHDDPNHNFVGETQNWMISPTICLAGPRAADQGIPPTLRSEADYVKVVFDFYSGHDDPDETGFLYKVAVRSMGSPSSSMKQKAGPLDPAWGTFAAPAGEYGYDPDSVCVAFDSGIDLAAFASLANTDSLQVAIQNQLRCARYFVPECGEVDGAYIDNIRVQFVRSQPFTGVDPDAPKLDFIHGTYPNPSPDGSATVKFSLSRATPVTIRFYDLRGALVHEAQVGGKAGENQYRWNGITRTGATAASGVYFYRLYADGVEFRNNTQRVVFVGHPDR